MNDNTIIPLTFKEAMSYLRTSRSSLYRLMWDGHLTGFKVGCQWRFWLEDLQKVFQKQSIAKSAA